MFGWVGIGVKRCVEGAWRVGQKLTDLGSFVEGAWKLGRKLPDLESFVEASWKLGRKLSDLGSYVEAWAEINRFGKLRGSLGENYPIWKASS